MYSFTVRCAYSSRWRLRAAALQVVEAGLLVPLLHATPRLTLFKVLCALLVRALSDKVLQVYCAALHLACSVFFEDEGHGSSPQGSRCVGNAGPFASCHLPRIPPPPV